MTRFDSPDPGHPYSTIMRQVLTLLLLFGSLFLHAQKTKTSTPTDTDQRIRQAQQDLEKLTPEQRKMMEQMGIQLPGTIPDPKTLSGQAGRSALTGDVPPKDEARIKKIPAAALTDAGLQAYISNTHKFVVSRLKPASIALGEKIYTALQSKKATAAQTGNTAAGLWVLGRVQPALYLMGKALLADPSNTDNQHNYAAMLLMSAGEPQAIPLLNKLNKQYPRNTSILNNLGQAWFNLGDLQKASPYLDSCLRIYRHHPQAAMTKAIIEISKGNKDKAVELVRDAMGHTLGMDKINQLRKLSYKLTANDISFPFRKNPDPMGLHGFKHPPFPKTAAEEIVVRKQWAQYYKDIQEKSMQLQQRLNSPGNMEKKMQEAKATQDYYMNNGKAPAQKEEPPMSFARRASLKLDLMDKDGGMKFRVDKALKDLKAHHAKMKPEHQAYFKAYQALDRQHALQVGEGKANKDFCQQFNSLADQYLTKWNEGHEALYDEYLLQVRLRLSEEIFWLQFIKKPEDFNSTLLNYQQQWLKALMAVSYKEIGDVTTLEDCFGDLPDSKPQYSELAEFNDIHCMYHSELNLGIGSIVSSCNKMVTSIEVGFVKLGLTQDMDEETFADQFVNFNVELSAGKSESVKLGPLTASVGVKGAIGIEVGRNGIQDVYVSGSAGAGVSTNVLGQMEEAGHPAEMGGIGVSDATVINVSVSGRISLISGRGNFDGLGIDLLK